MKKIFVAITLVFLTFVAGTAYGSDAKFYMDVLDDPSTLIKAPGFQGKDLLNDTEISLEDYDDYVLLICFWMNLSWLRSPEYGITDYAKIPDLIILQNLYSKYKFSIIAISIGTDTEEQFKKFIHNHGINFPVIRDSQGQIVGDYEKALLSPGQRLGYPTHLVVNRDGYIVSKHYTTTRSKLENDILPLLGAEAEVPKAPVFHGVNMVEGKEISSTDFEEHILLINFWDPGIDNCLEEIPELVKIHNRYKDQNFAVIGIASMGENDEAEADVMAAIQDLGISYPVIMDSARQIAGTFEEAWGGKINTIPTTFLVNKEGEIVDVIQGNRLRKLHEDAVRSLLDLPWIMPIMPNFQGIDLINGEPISKQDYEGYVYAINFWNTGGPSMDLIPNLVRIQTKYKFRKFSIIGISKCSGSEKEVRDIIESKGINYPVIPFEDKLIDELSQEMGRYVSGTPYTIVVNREGEIADYGTGYSGSSTFGRYEGMIQPLLGDIREGPIAPAFREKNLLDDRDISPEGFRGHVIVIDFWATYVATSRDKVPMLIEFYDKYKDQKFTVIGVSMDSRGGTYVRNYVESEDIAYPVIMATDQLIRDYEAAMGEKIDMFKGCLVNRSGEIMEIIDPKGMERFDEADPKIEMEQMITFYLGETYEPPELRITSTPVVAGKIGTAYTYDVETTGGTGALKFSLIKAPDGMAIDVDTGMIIWEPAGAQFGDNEVVVKIDDESGSTQTQSFAINITGIKGDVNGDGEVRSNDAMMALRIAAGLMIPTEYQQWAADMNDDGKVRANDATSILRKAAGLAAQT